jgi:hypothetical protein
MHHTAMRICTQPPTAGNQTLQPPALCQTSTRGSRGIMHCAVRNTPTCMCVSQQVSTPPPHSGLTTLTSPQLHAQGSLLVLGCKTLRVHRFTPLQHHQPPCLQILSVNQLQPVLERCERGYRGSTPPGGPAKSGPVTVATLGR